MNELMNQLINDEAVYRTAPATPGLLNIISRLCFFSQQKDFFCHFLFELLDFFVSKNLFWVFCFSGNKANATFLLKCFFKVDIFYFQCSNRKSDLQHFKTPFIDNKVMLLL